LSLWDREESDVSKLRFAWAFAFAVVAVFAIDRVLANEYWDTTAIQERVDVAMLVSCLACALVEGKATRRLRFVRWLFRTAALGLMATVQLLTEGYPPMEPVRFAAYTCTAGYLAATVILWQRKRRAVSRTKALRAC
jgi:peptidoglycan/LPS O-acetylase OafA/YrhL